METCERDRWFCKFPLGYVERDTFLLTSLEELSHVLSVVISILVIYDNVIHYSSESRKVCEGLVHATVVVL